MPLWAVRLVEDGIEPAEDEPGRDQWFGWRFCSERVLGLPDCDTDEGLTIMRRVEQRKALIARKDARKAAEKLGRGKPSAVSRSTSCGQLPKARTG
jgi:hypothetical protein